MAQYKAQRGMQYSTVYLYPTFSTLSQGTLQ